MNLQPLHRLDSIKTCIRNLALHALLLLHVMEHDALMPPPFDAAGLKDWYHSFGEDAILIFEGDTPKFPSEGPVVVAANASVVLVSAGQLHGSKRGLATEIGNIFGEVAYRHRELSVRLEGPMTAAQVMEALARRVAVECGRNFLLQDALYHEDPGLDFYLQKARREENEVEYEGEGEGEGAGPPRRAQRAALPDWGQRYQVAWPYRWEDVPVLEGTAADGASEQQLIQVAQMTKSGAECIFASFSAPDTADAAAGGGGWSGEAPVLRAEWLSVSELASML